MDIPSTIRQFIREKFVFSSEDTSFDDQASFMETGLVDSTGVLEIIQFIEENFGIAVQDEELIPENLDSVDNLSNFVSRKLSQIEQDKCAL